MVIIVKCILFVLSLPFMALAPLPSRAAGSPPPNPYAHLKGSRVRIPTIWGDIVGTITHVTNNVIYRKLAMVAKVVYDDPQLLPEYIPLSELPQEGCPECGVDHYPYMMCEGCGRCGRCCDCHSEQFPEPAEGEEDCLWFLRLDGDAADREYDDWRSG